MSRRIMKTNHGIDIYCGWRFSQKQWNKLIRLTMIEFSKPKKYRVKPYELVQQVKND